MCHAAWRAVAPGTWFGVLAGWIYDYTTLKCGGSVGPRVSGLAGVALVFIGYGCMYLAAARRITISFYVLGLCAFVMGQGSGFLYVAALNPNAANVGPRHEGKVRWPVVRAARPRHTRVAAAPDV